MWARITDSEEAVSFLPAWFGSRIAEPLRIRPCATDKRNQHCRLSLSSQ